MGYVELFLDVVYVYVLTRLTAVLSDDPSWLTAYQDLLLFMAMWWIWYRIARTTNRYNAGRPAIQLVVIYVMLGSLFLATSVAKAFGEWGLIFASVYVMIEVGRYAWLVVLGGDAVDRKLSACILFWALLSAGPWLLGGFCHGWARVAWWSLGLFLDYLGDILDFPTPILGRGGHRQHKLAEGHLTDRYRQFLIIALGETALVIGREYRQYAFQEAHTIGVLIAFAIMVLLWQLYFYVSGSVMRDVIASASNPSVLGELVCYAHLIMVAGIILTTVGNRLVVVEPGQHTDVAQVLVIFGGAAAFLLGRSILDYAAVSQISLTRPLGVITLAALVPAALQVHAAATAALAAVVLACVSIANFQDRRHHPLPISPPQWGPRQPGP